MHKDYLHVPYDSMQNELDRYMDYGEDVKTRYQHRQRLENVSKAIEGIKIERNSKVLDIGCGRGAYLSMLAKRSYNVVGIEVRRDINVCKSLVQDKSLAENVCIIRADAMNLPFKDNSFDFIICSEVLEHLDNPPRGAEEISRVIKPDGKALISMPNLISIHWLFNRLTAEMSCILNGEARDIDPHMKYPFWKIKSLLSNAGLAAKTIKGTYLLPSDIFFKFGTTSDKLKIVYLLNRLENGINIKCLNAFFFVIAEKRGLK